MPATSNHPHQPNDEAPKQNGRPVNDGSNDNPDEFSEFRKPDASATEDYSHESQQADPWDQPGHVEQNQNPEAVKAAQHASDAAAREAFKLDDPRYGSGPRPAPTDGQ